MGEYISNIEELIPKEFWEIIPNTPRDLEFRYSGDNRSFKIHSSVFKKYTNYCDNKSYVCPGIFPKEILSYVFKYVYTDIPDKLPDDLYDLATLCILVRWMKIDTLIHLIESKCEEIINPDNVCSMISDLRFSKKTRNMAKNKLAEYSLELCKNFKTSGFFVKSCCKHAYIFKMLGWPHEIACEKDHTEECCCKNPKIDTNHLSQWDEKEVLNRFV